VKNFAEQIKDYQKEAQSLGSLVQKTNEFFNERYFSLSGSGEDLNGNYIPGKIYTGEYLTKSELSDRIKFIDRRPLFLFISEEKINGESILKGLDLNIVPNEYRAKIIGSYFDNSIDKISSNLNNSSSAQEPILIKSVYLATIFGNDGYKFAMNGFKKFYMKSVKVVSYSDWAKIPFLTDTRIQGLSVSAIYNQYKTKLNS
jgi:hypothetical protein